MQVDSESFQRRLPGSPGWAENSFRYCEFTQVEDGGPHVDSVFLECTFTDCDFYWGLFNTAVFIGVKFKGTKFRGCSFADCRFVECEFENCEFMADSFGKGCSFSGSRWYACAQRGTIGLEKELVDAL